MGIKSYGISGDERSMLDAAQCREIVHEILNFGVNQNQILTIIKLLSLELEDRQVMLSLTEIIDNQFVDNSEEEKTTIIV